MIKVGRGEFRLDGSTGTPITVSPGASLSGTGTVGGALTASGTVSTGLQVNGDFTLSRSSTLLAGTGSLKVSGAVTVNGHLKIGTDRPGSLTVVDNLGLRRPRGLRRAEGRRAPSGTPYRITYEEATATTSSSIHRGKVGRTGRRPGSGPLTAAGLRTRNGALLASIGGAAALALIFVFFFLLRRRRAGPQL